MKTTFVAFTFIVAATLSLNAKQPDTGSIKNISCLNSEMTNDEIKEASASFLDMKIGHVVSLAAIRKLALNEDGSGKSGMGLIENASKLVLLVKADGYCQKSKVEKSSDGTDKTITTVGTMVISIQK